MDLLKSLKSLTVQLERQVNEERTSREQIEDLTREMQQQVNEESHLRQRLEEVTRNIKDLRLKTQMAEDKFAQAVQFQKEVHALVSNHRAVSDFDKAITD